MKPKQFLLLISCIIFAQLAGIIGSLFTTPAIPTWYAELVKPALNPPSWLFGPVWTGLFVLMGISVYVVLKHRRKLVLENKYFKPALIAFGAQWILNIGWSYTFFYLKRPDLAVVEITLLLISIIITITLFYRINRGAAYLLLPYAAWVSFATYLTIALWQLN